MHAVETLLLFGYTVKACEACTVGQSTNGKYAGDYDSFFRILRGALPAGCLRTQVEVVCKAPEIPLEGSWNPKALRKHTVHGNARILMVSCCKPCCCFDPLLLQEAQMMDALGGCWQGDTGTTVQPGLSPCANQLTGRGRSDAFKTGPIPGSIAKTAATGRKKHPTEADGRKKALTEAEGRKKRKTNPTEAEGRKKAPTEAEGRKKHKPRKELEEPLYCIVCKEEHPKKDFSKEHRAARYRLKAKCKSCRSRKKI